jgi:serine protease Do
VTIGDLDKVFAEAGNQQAEAGPETRGDAGESKLGLVVRQESDPRRPNPHPGRGHSVGPRARSPTCRGLSRACIITRINKQPTGTKDQYDAVVSKIKTGDDVVFEVMDPRHPEGGISYLGGTT